MIEGYSLSEYSREELESLFRRYKDALEGLTIGGSEFVNDPERCAKSVKDILRHKCDMIEILSSQQQQAYNLPIIGRIVRRVILKDPNRFEKMRAYLT